MKKIVLTMIAMMSLTVAFAETPKSNAVNNANAANYDMTVDYGRLGVVLSLDIDQLESVKSIHDQYIKAMKKVANAPEAERKALVKKVSEKELAQMRYILDRDQYRKYNMLINATLNNRGLLY